MAESELSTPSLSATPQVDILPNKKQDFQSFLKNFEEATSSNEKEGSTYNFPFFVFLLVLLVLLILILLLCNSWNEDSILESLQKYKLQCCPFIYIFIYLLIYIILIKIVKPNNKKGFSHRKM